MRIASISLTVVAPSTTPGISNDPSEGREELPSVMALIARCSLKNVLPAQKSQRTR